MAARPAGRALRGGYAARGRASARLAPARAERHLRVGRQVVVPAQQRARLPAAADERQRVVGVEQRRRPRQLAGQPGERAAGVRRPRRAEVLHARDQRVRGRRVVGHPAVAAWPPAAAARGDGGAGRATGIAGRSQQVAVGDPGGGRPPELVARVEREQGGGGGEQAARAAGDRAVLVAVGERAGADGRAPRP